MILINKHSLKLADLAPKEGSRYNLNAIHITRHETVATDGTMLTRVSHPTGQGKANDFPMTAGFDKGKDFEHILLPTMAAKEICAAVPKKQGIPILNNAALSVTSDENGAHIQVAVNDLENPKVFTPRPMTGNFPTWKQVMPKTEPKITIELDATKLLALLKYVSQFSDDRNHRIRLQVWDSQSTVRIDATNNETQQGMTAILMPVRRDDSQYPHAYGVAKAETVTIPPVEVVEPIAASAD